jgi:hypothetical protein
LQSSRCLCETEASPFLHESPPGRSIPELMMHVTTPEVCVRRLAFSITLPTNLAHLDDAAAGGLQVGHLAPQRQRQLEGLRAAGHVLAREGPVQDGDRACAAARRLSEVSRHIQTVGLRLDTALRGEDQFRMVTGPAQQQPFSSGSDDKHDF